MTETRTDAEQVADTAGSDSKRLVSEPPTCRRGCDHPQPIMTRRGSVCSICWGNRHIISLVIAEPELNTDAGARPAAALLYDVIAVDLKTHAVTIIGQGKSARTAEAIENMAIMRRGVEDSFYVTVHAGKYSDGDEWDTEDQGI